MNETSFHNRRQTKDLSGVWRYQPDVNNEGEKAGYWAENLDVCYWREANVPGRLDNIVPGMEAYEGIAWFHRTFRVDPSWAGRRIALHFEAVNNIADVWLNGQLIGQHADGFLPFEFRIDQMIRMDRENVLTVRVDNTRRAGEVPGLERGWRPFGGILREVTLVSTPMLHIGCINVSESSAEGRFSGTLCVANDSGEAANAICRLEIWDAAGTLCESGLYSASSPVQPGQQISYDFALSVDTPMLWSPEVPSLYSVKATLICNEKPVDQQDIRIGFRTIQTKGDKLFLNGKPIFLTGLNRHEDSPVTDMCPDMETARRDLLDMKSLGSNFVRLCHYPHHPDELDLCDEIGLLVMSEIPLYWWRGNTIGEEKCAQTLNIAKRQLAAMIQRDRHHPSIIFWSVSNETHENLPEVVAGNAELCNLSRQIDPTRLAVHSSCAWVDHPAFDADDVICLTYYPTVWGDHRDSFLRDPASVGAGWKEQLLKLQQRYPGKPILVVEFGHPALEGIFNNTLGEDAQALSLEAQFAGLTNDAVCGALIWCYAHHPWPEEPFINYMTTAPFGVVTRDRRRLAAWPIVQRMFHQRHGREVPQPQKDACGTSRDIGIQMQRPHMRDIPQHPLPEGYSIRPMRKTDGALWTDVQRDSEPILRIDDNLFWREFGNDPQAIERRCFLIYDSQNLAVGTISAWYIRGFKGKDAGRIHWIAIRPSQRGKGLARSAMTFAMNQLAQWHEAACLTASNSRLTAIKIYLEFGFLPDVENDAQAAAWRQVAAELDHPALASFRV